MEHVVKKYFADKAFSFDSIYTRRTSGLMRLLNRVFRWDMLARMRMAFDRLSGEGIQSILDVGCGSGRLSLALAEAGKEVIGLDFSTEMIGIAGHCREACGSDRAHFVCTDILSYSSERTFDAAVALGFFDYTKDPLPFLKKMASLTRGVFIATFPRRGTLRAAIRKARLWALGCPVYFYSVRQIGRLLEESGFSASEIAVVGQLYFVEARTR